MICWLCIAIRLVGPICWPPSLNKAKRAPEIVDEAANFLGIVFGLPLLMFLSDREVRADNCDTAPCKKERLRRMAIRSAEWLKNIQTMPPANCNHRQATADRQPSTNSSNKVR